MTPDRLAEIRAWLADSERVGRGRYPGASAVRDLLADLDSRAPSVAVAVAVRWTCLRCSETFGAASSAAAHAADCHSKTEPAKGDE